MGEDNTEGEKNAKWRSETPLTPPLELPKQPKPGESLVAPKTSSLEAGKAGEAGVQKLKGAGILRPDIVNIKPRQSPLGQAASELPQPEEDLLREPTKEELEEIAEAEKTGLFRGQKVVETINYGGVKGLKVKTSDGDLVNFTPGERKVAILREIPPGKNWDQLQTWVRDRVRRAEGFNEFTSKDFILKFREALGDYDITGPQPTPDELANLVMLMEVRGTFACAHLSLTQFNYDNFLDVWNNILGIPDKHLKVLWNEKLGTPENVIQEVAKIMEEQEIAGPANDDTAGSYWRETRPAVAPGAPPAPWLPTSKHAKVDVYLNRLFPAGTPDRDAKIAEAKFITEKLFIATGMATFYTGPVQVDAAGKNHLIDIQIMNEAAAEPMDIPGAPDYVIASLTAPPPAPPTPFPEAFYTRNFNYWRKWWQRREAGGMNFPDNQSGIPVSDPAGGLRRLIYQPEEARRLGVTKAQSLWFAGELYARPIPVWNGNKTLEAFMGAAEINDVKAVPFIFGNTIAQAGKAVTLMVNLFNEPIKGGQYAGDIDRLSNNLENLTKLAETFGTYLTAGTTRELVYFAESRLLASVFNYVNGKSPDRMKEFWQWPGFGSETLNLILNDPFFKQYLNQRFLDEALSKLKSSDSAVGRIKIAKSTGGILGKFGEDFLKAITRR